MSVWVMFAGPIMATHLAISASSSLQPHQFKTSCSFAVAQQQPVALRNPSHYAHHGHGHASLHHSTTEACPCRTRLPRIVHCWASPASISAPEQEAAGVTESGRYSISDRDLLSRGFELHSSMEGIDLDQLNALFVKVGFPRRHKEKLRRALQHTSSLRWLCESKSGGLVAFARATGDGVFNAIIWDVVVDPSYQGLGLGRAIMERLMVDLIGKGITNISLYAEPNVVGFYKPLGYIADPQGIRAMAYRKGR